MSDVALFALCLVAAVAAGVAAGRWVGRPFKQRAQTEADVHADAAAYRARRQAEQRADDLDICRYLWPNPPSWRTAVTQYRHDTAKQRKEEG
ncbi:hypothetical protein ABT010_13225 [Streptomyces sp. NPDC002668]|uniref:hypothetical protein n=1 Tax=Streptomyces sp. NPDC002668 TaxID=3154422 RepID=UPI00331BBDF1